MSTAATFFSAASKPNSFLSFPPNHLAKSKWPFTEDSPNPPARVPSSDALVPENRTGAKSVRISSPSRKEFTASALTVPVMSSRERIFRSVSARRLSSPFPLSPTPSRNTVVSNRGSFRLVILPLPRIGTPWTENPASSNSQFQEAKSIFPPRFLILIPEDA